MRKKENKKMKQSRNNDFELISDVIVHRALNIFVSTFVLLLLCIRPVTSESQHSDLLHPSNQLPINAHLESWQLVRDLTISKKTNPKQIQDAVLHLSYLS